MWKWQTRISSQLPTMHWFSCPTCGVNPMDWRRRQRRKSQHSLWSSTSSIPWISSCSRLDRTAGRCSNVPDQKEHRRTGLTQCAFLPHMFFADFKNHKKSQTTDSLSYLRHSEPIREKASSAVLLALAGRIRAGPKLPNRVLVQSWGYVMIYDTCI